MKTEKIEIIIDHSTIENDIDMVKKSVSNISELCQAVFNFPMTGNRVKNIRTLEAPLLMIAEEVEKTQFAKDNYDVSCNLISTALDDHDGNVDSAISAMLKSYIVEVSSIKASDKDAEQQKYIAQFMYLPIISFLVTMFLQGISLIYNDEDFDDDSDIEIMTSTTFH